MLPRKDVRIDSRIPWFADVRLALSPMVGVTDRPFRDICRDFGADLCFSEFTAAKGLLYRNEATWRAIDTRGEGGRVGIQIFGNDPDDLGAAARLMRDQRHDVLDINFGCPAKKVVKKCGGSALLADLPLLRRIVEAVVRESAMPVSAKFRTGWDDDGVNYREVGLLLQEAGCVFVTLHGRTRAQKFRGRADWERIADLVETLHIPVIGNGDVVDGESYEHAVRQSRCHAVMVGRGAMGNPWIFHEMRARDEGAAYAPPGLSEIAGTAARHVRDLCAWRGERPGALLMRKHLARYFRGFPGAAAIRRRLYSTEEGRELTALLDELAAAAAAGDMTGFPADPVGDDFAAGVRA